MKIQKENVNITVKTPTAKEIALAHQEEKRKQFNAYMLNLQDNFRNTITNISLHQGYLITHEMDFLYKTSNIKNEVIINSKELASEIKENIDIVKNIGEIDYNKKEYFANVMNKLNSFTTITENSIHDDYYKTISHQNKVDTFIKTTLLSLIISIILGFLIYLGINGTPAKEFSKYKSSIELLNKLLYLFNEHQIYAYSFTISIVSFIIFLTLSIKSKKKSKIIKEHLLQKALNID